MEIIWNYPESNVKTHTYILLDSTYTTIQQISLESNHNLVLQMKWSKLLWERENKFHNLVLILMFGLLFLQNNQE